MSRRTNVLREPLSAMLETRANVRTLRALCRHGGLLAAPSIVERTGLAKASVATALRSLERLGVIEVSGVRRAALYRICDAHPLAGALSNLFEAETRRFQDVLDAIKAATADSGALAVWIYGSAAHGEDDESSDLDIAVALTARNGAVEELVRERLAAAGRLLAFEPSAIFVDTADIARLSASDDPWWRNLVADALVLRGERPDWLAQRVKREAVSGRKRGQ